MGTAPRPRQKARSRCSGPCARRSPRFVDRGRSSTRSKRSAWRCSSSSRRTRLTPPQLKATEAQTLELLNGLVERLETDRGKLRVDQEEVRQQVRNIEAALQHEMSAQMRAKMDELMELASRGEYNAFDPKIAGVKRTRRDTDKE